MVSLSNQKVACGGHREVSLFLDTAFWCARGRGDAQDTGHPPHGPGFYFFFLALVLPSMCSVCRWLHASAHTKTRAVAVHPVPLFSHLFAAHCASTFCSAFCAFPFPFPISYPFTLFPAYRSCSGPAPTNFSVLLLPPFYYSSFSLHLRTLPPSSQLPASNIRHSNLRHCSPFVLLNVWCLSTTAT